MGSSGGKDKDNSDMTGSDETADIDHTRAAAEGRHAAGEDADQSGGRLDTAVQEQIGQLIKSMFDDVAKSPVPARFTELLAELENKELETKEKRS